VSEDPPTEELRLAQAERERIAREQAEHAEEDTETQAHERRADKAAYLKEKLAEAERAERERDDEG
jgi:hypothetical protein